ncbi:MAG: nuclear transport factor 2 family protein [Gammaproteobacteria bacterium]|nr:nuclear transport factor 2 family protein [Gammaproteobacteria bacterium]
MTNEEAIKFAFNSYVRAFEAGNEHMIDQYFAADLAFRNHSVAKSSSLNEIKASVLKVHQKYQNLKSVIKDVVVEGNRMAFRAEQHAFFVPDDGYVNMDVMNLYTLVDGKVKEWRLWFTQHADSKES